MSELRYGRAAIADAIVSRFDAASCASVQEAYRTSRPLQHFVIDELLPRPMAEAIHAAFPKPAEMLERRSLRERKYVAAQMDRYARQAEETVFGFQDPRVVRLVSSMTRLPELQADPLLYAGGISLMTAGNYLNPHVDNSHDNERRNYRVLNLLYYVSPNWRTSDGGHLELWPGGVAHPALTIENRFNRLVVMSTGPDSWHSVCEVTGAAPRCCVSNYYFSAMPIGGKHYFRVTSFRGRPGQPIRDALLKIDSSVRRAIRVVRPRGLTATKQIYAKQRTEEK